MSQTNNTVKPIESHALFAFFRDLTSAGSLNEGREHHAAGIILARHGNNSESLKDLCVMFLDPFSGYVQRAWRTDGEIEIYAVDELEWKSLKERYEAIEANVEPMRGENGTNLK